MADDNKKKLNKLKLPDRTPDEDLSPEELKIRKQAQEFQKKYGDENAPDEEGAIEGDLEDVIPGGSVLSMLTPLGGAKKALKQGVEAAPGIIRKISQKGAPLFSEAVESGTTGTGAKNFAKFIRGEDIELATAASKKAKPESLKVPRFGSSNKLKALQEERNTLDLKTEAGRSRLKEIDHMLKNRTYFKD